MPFSHQDSHQVVAQLALVESLISARREDVLQSYNSAKASNYRSFLEGDVKATAEYIYSNQKEDAQHIANMFYNQDFRVISVQKKTKVGADGLMIEIATRLTTHIDDEFIVNPANVRIITGMSNAGWEKDMKDKAPSCFKDKIFHHAKLTKANLRNITNGLIIIDEIDSGNKEFQVLHTTLKDADVLDVQYMKENNIRLVFISATMFKELNDLYKWGDLHALYKMTIPDSYIGHMDFLDMGIAKEFYPLNNKEAAERWIKEDILDYGTDYRVHIVRVSSKTDKFVEKACRKNNVTYINHDSKDRLPPELLKKLFEDPLNEHIVIGIRGLFRRANNIPNAWKMRIGATHECCTETVDNNVQIQGLPGRLTGYWRDIIEGGHRTGPYRTSIKSIKEYEDAYNEPLGTGSYQTQGYKKTNGKVSTGNIKTMLSPSHIRNLEPVDLPIVRQKGQTPIIIIDIDDEEKMKFGDCEFMFNTLRANNEEEYNKYKNYQPCCWRINSPEKCEKYGLKSMLKNGAYSSSTNIRNKKDNVIMFYLHESTIIISAWNGEETL